YLADNFAELARLSARGAGVFVTVNRTDLKGRRKENIVAVRALFVDLDGAPIVCDLPRVMRLPSFPHQKNPDNPRMVRFWVSASLAPYEADTFCARLE